MARAARALAGRYTARARSASHRVMQAYNKQSHSLSSQQDCISLALRAPWRDATCVSEAFCPNIQPRAHARLTGLTIITAYPLTLLLRVYNGLPYHQRLIARRVALMPCASSNARAAFTCSCSSWSLSRLSHNLVTAREASRAVTRLSGCVVIQLVVRSFASLT